MDAAALIDAYASQTGTKRNLSALRAAGWGLVLSPAGWLQPFDFPYVLDNAAWAAFTAFQRGEAATPLLDIPLWLDAVDKVGSGAQWIALPDIVMGGQNSLDLTLEWLGRAESHPILSRARLMIVVQNGFDPAVIEPLLGPRVGVFVGGDDDFKEGTMRDWCQLAIRRGARSHVGRVNSRRRIMLCIWAGAHSFDGSSATVYSSTLPMLDAARYQPDLFAHG